MPSITYGGVEYIQVRHALYCKKCKETIESKFILISSGVRAVR